MTVLTLRQIWKAVEARSWVEVPARVLEAKLHESSDSDGTTYQAQATYEYDYQGRTYRSTKVSWDSAHDNIGSWQREAFKRIEIARRGETDGTWINAWVNPKRPEEAVLFRDARPGMIAFMAMFGVVFGGVGGGMVFGLLGAIVRRRRVAARRRVDPANAWRELRCWHHNRIAGRTSANVWAPLGFALFWNAISWAVAGSFLVSGKLTTQPPVAWLVFLFPAVGVGLAWWAVRMLAKRISLGRVDFEADHLPLAPGGIVRGQLVFRRLPRLPLVAVVRCLLKVQQGKSTNERTLGEVRLPLRGEAIQHPDGLWRLPVRMDLPKGGGVRPTTLPDEDEATVRWTLFLQREGEKGEPALDIPLPVIRGGSHGSEQSADEPEDDEKETADLPQDPQALAAAFERSKVRREPQADGTVLYSTEAAAPRAVRMTVLLMITFVEAVGILIVILARFWFGFIGVVFGSAICLAVLYHLFLRSSVRLRPDRLWVEKRVGPFVRRQEVGTEAVTAIEPRSWVSVNERPFYQIGIETREGRLTTLAGLPDQASAQAVAERLREEMGVRRG